MKWLCIAWFVGLTAAAGCNAQPLIEGSAVSGPERYESSSAPNGSKMVLLCESTGRVISRCRFSEQKAGQPNGEKIDLEFMPLSNHQLYLQRLVGEAAAESVKNPAGKQQVQIALADISLLRELIGNQQTCLADKQYADLILACPVPKQEDSAVVLFLRGLCDRCKFEPVVLRKLK